jgi:hypothetical protein
MRLPSCPEFATEGLDHAPLSSGRRFDKCISKRALDRVTVRRDCPLIAQLFVIGGVDLGFGALRAGLVGAR